jgi:hypothetical protein
MRTEAVRLDEKVLSVFVNQGTLQVTLARRLSEKTPDIREEWVLGVLTS